MFMSSKYKNTGKLPLAHVYMHANTHSDNRNNNNIIQILYCTLHNLWKITLRHLLQTTYFWIIRWEELIKGWFSSSFWRHEAFFTCCIEWWDCSTGLLRPYQIICYCLSHHVYVVQLALLWTQISAILLNDKQQVCLCTEGQPHIELFRNKSCTVTFTWLEVNVGSSRQLLYAHFYDYGSLARL